MARTTTARSATPDAAPELPLAISFNQFGDITVSCCGFEIAKGQRDLGETRMTVTTASGETFRAASQFEMMQKLRNL